MATPVVVSRIQNRRGLQSDFNSLYPNGYNGTGGYGSIPGFTPEAYPNVLLPGELALCTDSRRTFVGNLNGEYVEFASSSSNVAPIRISLPASATFVVVPGLSYLPQTAQPFITIPYDLTDDPSVDWGTPGTNFSRNGSLEITAIKYVATPPAATLTDSGTEINVDPTKQIIFQAVYNTAHTAIEIQYMHNFPGPLTFTSTSIIWQSL